MAVQAGTTLKRFSPSLGDSYSWRETRVENKGLPPLTVACSAVNVSMWQWKEAENKDQAVQLKVWILVWHWILWVLMLIVLLSFSV